MEDVRGAGVWSPPLGMLLNGRLRPPVLLCLARAVGGFRLPSVVVLTRIMEAEATVLRFGCGGRIDLGDSCLRDVVLHVWIE